MHASLVRHYIQLQALLLTPIAPHWAEYMHIDVLANTTSIQHSLYPSAPSPDPALTAAKDYVRATSSNITSAEGAQQKKLAKGKSVSFDPKANKKLTVFAAKAFPAWQGRCVEIVRDAMEGLSVDVKKVSQRLDKSEVKRAMPFVNALKKRLEQGEAAEVVFERKLVFDELEVLGEMVRGLKQTVQKCVVVEIVSVEEGGKRGTVVAGVGDGVEVGAAREGLPVTAEGAMPGQPTFHFENV